MKTKAVRLYGKEDLRLEEFELPEMQEDEILAEVVSDSLCMSSYKAAKLGADHKRVPNDVGENPTIVGHEFAGKILEVGDKWKHKFKPGDKFNYKDVEIVGTKTIHSPKIEGFGLRFNLKEYSLAFASDTMVFDGFSEQFDGVNILILNLLRPDSITCRRHLCTDEVIPYLNKIDPPLNSLIITHFGSYMDSPRSTKNYVPSQVKKLQESTNIKNIIAAEDGLKLKIRELLK